MDSHDTITLIIRKMIALGREHDFISDLIKLSDTPNKSMRKPQETAIRTKSVAYGALNKALTSHLSNTKLRRAIIDEKSCRMENESSHHRRVILQSIVEDTKGEDFQKEK